MKTRLNVILAVAAAGMLAMANQASANTITPSVATVNSPGTWTYNGTLSSGQVQVGDGFTIFDFGGYVAGSIAAPVGWTATATLLGSPYGGDVGAGGDNPGQYNLTFVYNGATVTTLGSVPLGQFTAQTTSTATAFAGWVSHDHQPDGTSGNVHQDIILVPSAVPDGGTAVALLGLGLVAVGAVRRKLAA